jgi:predicted ABC-type ATPase
LLTGHRRVAEFVNADVIAKEQGVSEIQAGRITLNRLTALAEARQDMAFETTLASHLLLPRIRSMQASGYRFHLFFFWLPNADTAVKRVASRVASGGHNIPEDVIRRRYERGLDNFFNHYLVAADSWVLMNNTARRGIRIASRDIGGPLRVKDNELWKRLSAQYMKPRVEEKKVLPHPEQPWTAEDIEDAVNRAVTAALKRHKALGQSVVMWRDGRIVTLKPDEIEI